MRGLFRYCPPRIVSAKCTRQLSRSSTLPIAAAMPPSAITVCALPSSDFVTTPVFTPAAEASIAARNPAPPAPTTRTSYSYFWYSAISLEEPYIVPDAHGAEPHVHVRESHPEQTHPREQHVTPVQRRHAVIAALARRAS